MPRYTEWPKEDRRALAKDVVDELLARDLFGRPDRRRTVGQVLKDLARGQMRAGE